MQASIRTVLDQVSRILPATYYTVRQDSNNEASLSLEWHSVAAPAEKRALVSAAIATFNQRHRERGVILAREAADIHHEIAAFADGHPQLTAGKSAETLMNELLRTTDAAGLRTEPDYYRLAVFEPGLSAEQRRLLFDAALRQLTLPLPGGELQP